MKKEQPLTAAEARAALRKAGHAIGKRGVLSEEHKALAEKLSRRRFPVEVVGYVDVKE